MKAFHSLKVMRGDPWEALGVGGLYVFSFGAVLGIALVNLGLVMMTIAALAQYRDFGRALRRCPPCLLILLGGVLMLVSAWIAAQQLPDWADWQWKQARQWSYLVFVVVVAWWLRREPKRFYIAATLFAAGATTRVLTNMPWDDLGGFLRLEYPRWDFELAIISFSSYFVVILFTMGLFFPRLWGWASRFGGKGRALLVGISIFVAFVALQVIIVGQSRGTWLAALVVGGSVIVYLAYSRWRSNPRELVYYGATMGVALALLALVLLPNAPKALQRLSEDSEVVARLIAEGDVDRVPLTKSVGVRVHLYRVGIERWLERPFFGWGTGSEKYAMRLDEMFPYPDGRPPHFHNIVIELLVRFGLVGFLMIAAIVVLAYGRAFRLHRRAELPEDWFLLIMTVLAFGLIWGMTDIRIIRWDYRSFFMIYFGMVLALQPSLVGRDFLRQLKPGPAGRAPGDGRLVGDAGRGG